MGCLSKEDRGGKNDRKRGKKEEIYEKMRGKKEKGNKKVIRTKNRGMVLVGKKREMESKKKDDFAVRILGSFFKSGMGRLSKLMK